MAEYRFRVPYRRKFVLPTIPIRPTPMYRPIVAPVAMPPRPLSPRARYSADDIGPVNTVPRNVPPVVLPPRPQSHVPDITLADIGPVGPPAHVSLADIGPVNPQPDLPDWIIEEARLKAPDIRFPQMPREMVEEGRRGVNVKPQQSDYVAPPVTSPRELIHMNDVAPGPSEAFILNSIEGDVQKTQDRAIGIPDRDIELRDLNLDLLKGTSRYAAGLGMTHGRTLGEGI